jgi:excisionase family DNA binding protein
MQQQSEQTDLRVGEVAAVLGLPKTTIRESIAKGTLRSWRTPRGHNRITVEALVEFAESLGVTLTAVDLERRTTG